MKGRTGARPPLAGFAAIHALPNVKCLSDPGRGTGSSRSRGRSAVDGLAPAFASPV